MLALLSDHREKPSMMRFGYFTSVVLGVVLTLAGIVAAFMKLPDAAIMVTTGPGMITGSAFAKAVQAKWEQGK